MPNPIELELISLDETLVNHPDYDNALKLARTGLWSPALDLLQPLQPNGDGTSPIKWSPAIQAQFDLIRFHAGLTKAQAIAAWASPNQQVLAKLIDGRWAESLKIFTANLANSADTAKLLQADQGRLWARINTTLRVNPNEQEAIAWGALLIASQQGREEAIAWLDSNTGLTQATRQKINQLLGQLEEAIALASLLETHTSQIMGTVMPLEQLQQLKLSQWSRPPASPALKLDKLDQNKTWYVIKVAGFHNGQAWQRQPFSKLLTPTNTYIQWLWRQLGLHKNKEITIGTWGSQERQSINAQIHALRVENQQLFLLASGENISFKENLPAPLAMTASAIKFLEPTPLKLGELVKQNPQQAANILPQMWQELQNAGVLEYGPVPDTNTIASKLANWVVQTIDLTGNNQPEIMLSIDTNNLATMERQFSANADNPSQLLPRSIIFADTGKLIYSEFSTNAEQVLSGLADLQDGGPVALVVDNRQNYQLARWSGDQQKFE
jgi:hypothetical protein